MDNNKPTDQTQPIPATPVQPSAFANTPTNPAVIEDPKTTPKSNINIWIAVALIILVLILAGGYFYLTQTSKNEPAPTPKPATQQNKEGSMESELNSLNVESEGNDFAEVDKDIQGL